MLRVFALYGLLSHPAVQEFVITFHFSSEGLQAQHGRFCLLMRHTLLPLRSPASLTLPLQVQGG